MRIASVLMLLVTLCLCTGVAFADPANDTREQWDHTWTPLRATLPEVEPNNDCATAQPVSLGDIVDPASISPAGDLDFYKIYLNTTDQLSIILDRATGCTTTIDTQLYVYRDDCVTQLAYDDDDGPGLYSYIAGSEFVPPYSGYYYVKVKHYSATGTGCYKAWFYLGASATGACCSNTAVCTLVGPGSCTSPSTWQGPGTTCTPNPCAPPPTGACCVPATGACSLTLQANCVSPAVWHAEWTVCDPNPCPQPQPPPVNDTCAGAIVIDRCTNGVINGDLSWAVNDYNPAVPGPSCTGYAAMGRDVTYKVDLVVGDVLDLSYLGNPAYDGSIYVVTDCANVSGSCVAGTDTYPNPPAETIHYVAAATATYFIICDAYSANTGGPFALTYAITCPAPTGSCCYPNGTCAVTTQADCTAIWLAGGVCNPNTCPQPSGSCCYPDGNCAVTIQAGCTGVWTDGGVCIPNTCPQPPVGSCCYPDLSCAVTTQFDCTGIWLLGGVCDPNTCAPPPPSGSCCYPDGSCAVTTSAECNGVWTVEGNCDPNLCPPPPPQTGSCCYADGTCAVTLAADCSATWLLGGNCDPNICIQPPPTGACCNVATGACTITTQVDCLAPLVWLGANVPCNTTTCQPPTPIERASWGQIKNIYR
jgi:hypothetical protein